MAAEQIRRGAAAGSSVGWLARSATWRAWTTRGCLVGCYRAGWRISDRRPLGAPRMTYGRSVLKALDTFDLDHKKWPELAADRLAWRAMLQSGQPPPAYRAPPPTRAALPIANTRPQRSSLAATTAAMQNSVQRDAATTRLGGKKKTYQN